MNAALELANASWIRSTSSHGRTPDERLLVSIAQGDRRSLEQLYARHNEPVYHFIVRLTGDASLAEEIVSDVFVAVWRGAGGFEARSRVSTWLLAIARNKAVEARRRRTEAQLDDAAAEAIVDDAASPETESQTVSRNAFIRRCLARLSPGHRELIDLVYYHGKTVAETAQIVGIPPGTVKSRMTTARCQLAKLLKGAGLGSFKEC